MYMADKFINFVIFWVFPCLLTIFLLRDRIKGIRFLPYVLKVNFVLSTIKTLKIKGIFLLLLGLIFSYMFSRVVIHMIVSAVY